MFPRTPRVSGPSGLLVRLLLAAALAVLASCGSPDLPTATELTTLAGPSRTVSLDREVADRITSYRQSKGRKAQTRHAGLDKLARMHARRMLERGRMDHDNYHYRLGMAEKYYGLGGLRENVASGQGFSREDMGQAMVNGWIASRGHRSTLLARETHYGVGIAIGEDGSFYAAHLVASPAPEKSESSFRGGMPLSYSNKYGAAMGPEW